MESGGVEIMLIMDEPMAAKKITPSIVDGPTKKELEHRKKRKKKNKLSAMSRKKNRK